MGIIQCTEGGRPDTTLENNPFVPPPTSSCPISRLPPELLSLVFEHGVSTNDDPYDDDEVTAQFWNDFGDVQDEHRTEDRDGDLDSELDSDSDSDPESEESDSSESLDFEDWPPFEILVSHVCKHWRTVALETPSLWTTIDVSCDERPPYERVATYLERSKSLPLSIRIDCEPPDDDFYVNDEEEPRPPSVAELWELLELLIPHVPRWGFVRMDAASYEHMYTFLEAVSAQSIPPAAQLQRLQLYHHEDMETDEVTTFAKPDLLSHFTLFGGSAPCLRSVALWGVHVNWSQAWLQSASNLTELELAYHSEDVRPTWAAFSSILRNAPALKTLNLCSSGPSGPPVGWIIDPSSVDWTEGINSSILLNNLSELVLAFLPSYYAVGLLRRLCTPALKKLVLDFDSGEYDDLVSQLVGPATLMAPSFNGQPRNLLRSLENLKLAGLPCSPNNVDLLYDELVNLKTLHLSMTHLPRRFLEALLFPSCTVLPALETIYISDVDGEELRLLVTQRKDWGLPLKTVYTEESPDIDPDDVAWLRANLDKFEFFEGSDDEEIDVIDIAAEGDDDDDWSDVSE